MRAYARAAHTWIAAFAIIGAANFAAADTAGSAASTGVAGDAAPAVVVLGIAQDGGVPQAGTRAWPADRDLRLVACLALIDPASGERWLFDATPDLKQQLWRLDQVMPVEARPGIDGVFLTHAHIGHYTGLMLLGHESLGARGVRVFAMPRMRAFLEQNGPWSQLVRFGNISLENLAADSAVVLNGRLRVTPIRVPHRQEFSEVVGFVIRGPAQSALYIPDIDSWTAWDAEGTRIEDVLASVDVAYLDGTFYANGEIPGRDMSGFPHPFIAQSLQRFGNLPATERAKIRFIHLNHTNPALRADSPARRAIEAAGMHVAEEMERFGL